MQPQKRDSDQISFKGAVLKESFVEDDLWALAAYMYLGAKHLSFKPIIGYCTISSCRYHWYYICKYIRKSSTGPCVYRIRIFRIAADRRDGQ